MPTSGNRLIFRMIAVIRRIDTTATEYDPVFREPIRVAGTNVLDPATSSARAETIEYRLDAQILDENMERLRQMSSGDSPVSFFDLTVHRRGLNRLGLIDASGTPLLGKQDRLVQILNRKGGLETSFDDPPGLYLHEIRPRSFGLSLKGPRRNLWFLHFRSRDAAPMRR